MDKSKLNSLRRMAGIPQDFTADRKPVKEDAPVIEEELPGISQIFRGGDHKFYLVTDAKKGDELGDVLTELDFPALVNILRSAENTKEWELIPHNQKNKALDLARKRLAMIDETVGYGMEARRPENTPHPTDEEMAKAEQEEVDFDDWEDEWEPSTNICPECEGGEHPPVHGVCERCGGLGEIYEGKKPDFADIDKDGDKKETAKKAAKDKEAKEEEEEVKECACGCDPAKCSCKPGCKCGCNAVKESMHYYDTKYSTFSDDDDAPINVDSSGEETVWDKSEENKEDYEMTNDTTTVKVPAKVLSELKRVIQEVTAEAEKAKPRDFERAHYYEATAEAMQIVHDFLAMKTVEGVKRAQIYVHKMANVSRALFPDLVWKFIIDGGPKRSLKSYMNDVKEPVTGKPFTSVDVKTLNKNTHTE